MMSDIETILDRHHEDAWNEQCEAFCHSYTDLQRYLDREVLTALDKEFKDVIPGTHVMISVLAGPHMIHELSEFGFQETNKTTLGRATREITGGYYSYVRGDRDSSPRFASNFLPATYEVWGNPTYKSGPIRFGISVFTDPNLGDERDVAHWLGPEDILNQQLRKFIAIPDVQIHCGSVAGDLETALFFWEDKNLVRNRLYSYRRSFF